MPPLRELQQRLAAHLFGEESADIVPWLCADGIAPVSRLGIYRNNLHEGFTRTLALEFPVVRRLVGADYFRQLARAAPRAPATCITWGHRSPRSCARGSPTPSIGICRT